MGSTYEIIEGMVVKKYNDGHFENVCLLEDVGVVIDRTRETLDRMSDKLSEIIEENKDSVVSIMFHNYVEELNELKKIQALCK